MIGALKPSSTCVSRQTGRGKGAGAWARVVLHGASGRAYNFKAHALSELPRQADVEAVYVYARAVSADTAHAAGRDATEQDYEIGYIGTTSDVAERAALHDLRKDFQGHNFDVALLVPLDHASIRAEIWQDLIDLYRPILNELLGSDERAKSG